MERNLEAERLKPEQEPVEKAEQQPVLDAGQAGDLPYLVMELRTLGCSLPASGRPAAQ